MYYTHSTIGHVLTVIMHIYLKLTPIPLVDAGGGEAEGAAPHSHIFSLHHLFSQCHFSPCHWYVGLPRSLENPGSASVTASFRHSNQLLVSDPQFRNPRTPDSTICWLPWGLWESWLVKVNKPQRSISLFLWYSSIMCKLNQFRIKLWNWYHVFGAGYLCMT